MTLLRRLLDLKGRARRIDYWRMQLWLTIAVSILWVSAVFLTMYGIPGWAPMLLVIPVALLIWPVAIRRLHDRNKSGWWMLPFAVAPYLLYGLTGGLSVAAEDNPALLWPLLASSLAGFVLGLWGLIEIGFLKGAPGPNRFGPAVR